MYNKKLEELKTRLRDIEDALRRVEEKLGRYEYFISRPSSPSPVLKSSEEAFIRRVGGLSSLPSPNSENLRVFREAALRIIDLTSGLELPPRTAERMELIGRILMGEKALTVRNILYIASQLIEVLTCCAERMDESQRQSAVNELEILIEIEARELPV